MQVYVEVGGAPETATALYDDGSPWRWRYWTQNRSQRGKPQRDILAGKRMVDGEMRRRLALVVPHAHRALMINKAIEFKQSEAVAFADILNGLSAGIFLAIRSAPDEIRHGTWSADASGSFSQIAALADRHVVGNHPGKGNNEGGKPRILR